MRALHDLSPPIRPLRSGAPLGGPAHSLRLRDSERLRRYRQHLDFYEGRHFPRSGSGGRKNALVLNYARTIVDKGVAYLLGRGLGFSVAASDEGSPSRGRDAEALLYEVYWGNDLDAVDLQVAQNAGVLGDGVYKVFFDPLREAIRVVNVDPFSFFATWAADDPSELRRVEVAYTLDAEQLASWVRMTDDRRPTTEQVRSSVVLRLSSKSSSAGRLRSCSWWWASGSFGASRTRTASFPSCTFPTSSPRTSSGASATWWTWPRSTVSWTSGSQTGRPSSATTPIRRWCSRG
jgi:hypothetical protein